MTKKACRRYTEAQRNAILDDMERRGLTQVATAKEHGVSAVTIWQWRRAARTPKRRAKAPRPVASSRALDRMLRAEVRDRVRRLLPEVVREEVAIYLDQFLGRRR